ncbi:MAG TPA: hypothetical protein VF412_17265 [Bdellovibrio sp.]|uniref:hypothetical protein n=1 Tax=Bdellovibrio sp. TaxID=28201 RepID=UPI002F0F8FB8
MSSFDWMDLQFACCFFLTGVIWVIQLTHYPAFAMIVRDQFVTFHKRHTSAMGFIVGPGMIVELLTAILLCREYQLVWICNLAGVLLIWGMTIFWSIPSHSKLAQGQDLLEIRNLVRTNWFRTCIWTVRSFVFILMIASPHAFLKVV